MKMLELQDFPFPSREKTFFYDKSPFSVSGNTESEAVASYVGLPAVRQIAISPNYFHVQRNCEEAGANAVVGNMFSLPEVLMQKVLPKNSQKNRDTRYKIFGTSSLGALIL